MQLFSVLTLPLFVHFSLFSLNKIYRLREIFCLSLSIEKKEINFFALCDVSTKVTSKNSSKLTVNRKTSFYTFF